jgi:threonine dehydratase
MNDYNIPLSLFQAARERIKPYVRHTPLMPLPALTEDFPGALRLKLENLQLVGSFKTRGVFNTLLQIGTTVHGVIAASGGNHGLALAYGAHRLGVSATIYLPETASADREARIAHWGARVIRHGRAWDDAHTQALQHAEHENLTYVHPFDAETTMAGQGTLGLELLDDVPGLDCVLIAVGGGGLIAGMAAAIKQIDPAVRVIGIEPVGAPSMLRSMEAGRVVELPEVRTIADTLSPRAVSEKTLALARRYVDEIVLVDDNAMIEGMRWLWLHTNQLVEPSGAAVIAALQTGAVDISRYRQPVALICGGNATADPIFDFYTKTGRSKGSIA